MTTVCDRVFTAADVARAAGVKLATFAQWQARFGLARGGDRSAYQRFTLAEACRVRAVAVISKHGIPLADACDFVEGRIDYVGLAQIFKMMIDGVEISPFVAFHKGRVGHPDQLVMDTTSGESVVRKRGKFDARKGYSFIYLDPLFSVSYAMADTTGVVTVLDLRCILNHVTHALRVTLGPAVQPEPTT